MTSKGKKKATSPKQVAAQEKQHDLGPTGPDTPGETGELPSHERMGVVLSPRPALKISILRFEIMNCLNCKRDTLFANVVQAGNPKKYWFCTLCGQYTEA